jgi:hypothetical protein
MHPLKALCFIEERVVSNGTTFSFQFLQMPMSSFSAMLFGKIKRPGIRRHAQVSLVLSVMMRGDEEAPSIALMAIF